MLSNIVSISNAGVLAGFSGATAQLPDFKTKNLIYGWNASGKTTLSRLFGQLEPGVGAPQLPEGACAVWKTVAGAQLDARREADRATVNVRVFNRDFVERNLSDHTRAPSLFIIGEDNIRLTKRIERLQIHRDRLAVSFRAAQRASQDAERAYERLATDRASACADRLGVRNFRAPNLKALAVQLEQPASDLLDDVALAVAVDAARDRETYQTVNLGGLLPLPLPQAEHLAASLSECPQQQAIAHLVSDTRLSDWVRQGLQFHQHNSQCAFCGGDASQALADYAKHFSDAYSQLRQRLLSLDQRLAVALPLPTLPPEQVWAPPIRDRARTLADQAVQWQEAELQIRARWRAQIAEKLERMDLPVDVADVADRSAALGEIHAGLRELVAAQRRIIDQAGQIQAAAAEKVKRHFAARYVTDEECKLRLAEHEQASAYLSRVTHVGTKAKDRIHAAQAKLQQQSVAAAEINVLLHKLLGGRIKAAQAADSQLKFMRGLVPAANLSDGERTAVSLSYFLVSLRQGGAQLTQTIVFVDDPISSLDANHVHQVSVLLLRHLQDAKQLFISTHSSELFNAIKEEWTDRGNFKAKTAGYLMHRVSESTSQLAALPQHLSKFRSDYHHVFHCLARISQSCEIDVDLYIGTPNLVRRFLEMYLGARLPEAAGIQKKMHILFDDSDVSDSIYQFANEGSHSQTSLRMLQVSDFPAQSRDVVRTLFEALRAKDVAHFNALLKETKVEWNPG
ncbi:AAA family ATPase [Stenotrophomonas rhizophila]|uniref:AAA family ATPase n=1 Tax=Stenotrophomonas rhizophila TaxID=216778 RepID=UPI001E3C6296|nr:AAA family ATPase [Stenotrophomonas rhizophila]MCC7635351.1 AAA family ATPase [Stenotrophomonas rhizophila]MCC7664420.1 AAA family ATPase [Stenotrophomonas rhizophila]